MALCTVLLMSLGWTAMLHEGIGLPVIGRSISNEPEPGHRQRAKRCSCNNQLDTECHYFCHLDIIWVNTPSKTTIYGLGSPMARRRRSTGRCACATTADQTCKSFCIHSLKNGAVHQNSISMWKNLEHLRPDLNDADPENVVTEETEDEFQDDVLTFIRNLMRAKAAMKLVASAKQKNLLSHKTGYR